MNPTNYDQAYQEYLDALNGLQVATLQFDRADPEHIDIAVHQLQAAELKVGVALRSVKGGNTMPIEVKQHLEKLRSFLNSDSLGADGRIWLLNEIWDIEIDQQIDQQIDTAKSHPAR